MAEPRALPASVSIGRMTVRGSALTAAQGRAVALWAARELASRHAAAGGAFERVTLRLPATALRPDGSIDHAAALDWPGGGHG